MGSEEPDSLSTLNLRRPSARSRVLNDIYSLTVRRLTRDARSPTRQIEALPSVEPRAVRSDSGRSGTTRPSLTARFAHRSSNRCRSRWSRHPGLALSFHQGQYRPTSLPSRLRCSLDSSLASLAHRLAIRWLSRRSSHPLAPLAVVLIPRAKLSRARLRSPRSSARAIRLRRLPASSDFPSAGQVPTPGGLNGLTSLVCVSAGPIRGSASDRGYPAERARAR
jgi:hypothetical protein